MFNLDKQTNNMLRLPIPRQSTLRGLSVALLPFTLTKQNIILLLNNMTVLGISTAIVYIALDTRLGCLDANLAQESEDQKMIDSVQVQLESLLKLEFGFPMWKYVSTPTWRKFVKASDVFAECV